MKTVNDILQELYTDDPHTEKVLKEWAKEIIMECSNIVREYPEDAMVQIQNLVYEI